MVLEQLTDKFTTRAKCHCSMKPYNTFRIGGVADVVVTVESVDELQWVLQFIRGHRLNWRIVGKGSNLLVNDSGFHGVIVLLGTFFERIEVTPQGVVAGAGLIFNQLITWCQRRGLGGAEFLFGVPGSVGGAVFMNAGAFGTQIADILVGMELVTVDEVLFVPREKMQYGYRCLENWDDLGQMAVITKAWFDLYEADSDMLKKRCSQIIAERKSKQPQGVANAGSFFKNPEGDSAGRLIEACGLKGCRVGDAMVSEKHANFLVNIGNASSEDVIALMNIVQEKVFLRSGIKLVPEVHFL